MSAAGSWAGMVQPEGEREAGHESSLNEDNGSNPHTLRGVTFDAPRLMWNALVGLFRFQWGVSSVDKGVQRCYVGIEEWLGLSTTQR